MSSNCYFQHQKVSRTKQISERYEVTMEKAILSYIVMSHSDPFHCDCVFSRCRLLFEEFLLLLHTCNCFCGQESSIFSSWKYHAL